MVIEIIGDKTIWLLKTSFLIPDPFQEEVVFGYNYEEEEENDKKATKIREYDDIDVDIDVDIEDDIEEEINKLYGLDERLMMKEDDDESEEDVDYRDEFKMDLFFREIVMCKLGRQSRKPYYSRVNQIFRLILNNYTAFHVIADSQLADNLEEYEFISIH